MKRVYATVAFAFVVVAALAGAGTGGAGATMLDVDLTELIDSINAGGTAGYTASVENTGPSTVSHVTLVVDTSFATASGGGTYRASQVSGDGSPSCAVDPGDGSRMVCTATQLGPEDAFSVNVAFSTPASLVGDSLETTASATVSAQTKGNPDNQGTSTWSAEPPASTPLLAATGGSFRSFSLPDDPLGAAGSGLTAAVDLPSAFLNGHFGLVTESKVFTGDPLCDKCPAVFSGLSIPASLTAANPFSASSPYGLSLTLEPGAQPPGYKVAGISHLGDEVGAVWTPVPLCTSPTDVVPGPICLGALPSKNKKTGVITATVRGFENGSLGYD